LAWVATYATAVRELAAWADRLAGEGRFGEVEELILAIGAGEYCAQVFGGIPMSQGEIVRPDVFGLDDAALAALRTPALRALVAEGNTAENRARLATLIRQRDGASSIGDTGLDETLEAIRAEMSRFADAEVVPHAQDWHRTNSYIPLETIADMA